MTSTAPTTSISDAPAAQVAAPAHPQTSAPTSRRSFLARPAVRWVGAALLAILLVGGGFVGGFAAGATSGIFGPSATTMRGPGGTGFPGGQAPDGQFPSDGQMPQRPGTGSGSSSGGGSGDSNGTGSGTGTNSGTDSGTGS